MTVEKMNVPECNKQS